MLTVIAFLVALTVLIFVHESGHYWVARRCGVKVLRFSIGFGKPLLRWRVGRDRTEWTLSAIPLGGYVRMLDERELADEPIDPRELPRAFNRQSLPKRAAIVAAGPIANFVLAIALYWLLNIVGVQEPAAIVDRPVAGSAAEAAGVRAGDRVVAVDGHTVRSWNEVRLQLLDAVIEHRPVRLAVERDGAPLVLALDAARVPSSEIERDFLRMLGLELAVGRVTLASVLPGEGADAAGLKPGDQILAVDGVPVRRSGELIERIRDSAGRALRFEVLRDGVTIDMSVVPQARTDPAESRAVGRIGAGLSNQVTMVDVRYGPIESLGRGVQQTWDMSVFSLRMLGKMVTGQLSWRHLSGPVAIADFAGQSARVGWFAYVSFLALISISLGVLNLLPIPVLDGGHLVYYALEALKGRPLSERFLVLTQRAGLAAIGLLMAVALFNDISRLIGS